MATRYLTPTRALLIIALATVLAYANTLRNDFVWDDEVLVKDNAYIRNFTYLAPAFVTDLARTGHSSAAYYRPLQTISYMLDYRLWGLNPAGYHLTNLLLHLTCALLVWQLARKLIGHGYPALFVALLFAVHPVNSSAVAYVAGRADMLACAGMLGSFLCFIRYRQDEVAPCSRGSGVPAATGVCPSRRGRRSHQIIFFATAILCFIFALFSRENAMLLPALLFLCCLVTERRFRQAALAVVPFVLVLVCFVVWRAEVLRLHDRPLLADWGVSAFDRVQLMSRALATYVGLLLWPAHLQMDRQLAHGGAWLHVLTVAGIALAGGLTFILCRARPTVRFGVAWFLVALLPVSGLLDLTASVAEHWLYVPSIGLYLALAIGVSQLRVNGRGLATIASVASVALGLRTAVRNHDWINSVAIYRATVRAAPGSLRVRNNLGLAHTEAGDYPRALAELREAERTSPADPQIKANLAIVYQLTGDLKSATRQNAECLKLDPHNVGTLLRIAYLYELRGNFPRARDHFMAALAITPETAPRLIFARFLLQHGRCKEALRVVQNAYDLDPGNAEVFRTLGNILAESGQYRLAAEAFEMAHALDPHAGEPEIIFN